eukprot:scaffold45512_cov31-Tisochrysis_lutea.AAC.6
MQQRSWQHSIPNALHHGVCLVAVVGTPHITWQVSITLLRCAIEGPHSPVVGPGPTLKGAEDDDCRPLWHKSAQQRGPAIGRHTNGSPTDCAQLVSDAHFGGEGARSGCTTASFREHHCVLRLTLVLTKQYSTSKVLHKVAPQRDGGPPVIHRRRSPARASAGGMLENCGETLATHADNDPTCAQKFGRLLGRQYRKRGLPERLLVTQSRYQFPHKFGNQIWGPPFEACEVVGRIPLRTYGHGLAKAALALTICVVDVGLVGPGE